MKTDWYRGDQKPVRVGVYERQYRPDTDDGLFCWFDGKFWHGGFFTIEECLACVPSKLISLSQSLPWRGIKK